ncbi:unnamed protein product [Brassicogethes aeneus]|uniref:Uncharacterized protein n=1 Tax=Brassicogethes aeneus TaxID=1431903 RepID=A0A9P0AQS5_BRAAE|nr:unnamed protein product [Brassicogethes aeneus]
MLQLIPTKMDICGVKYVFFMCTVTAISTFPSNLDTTTEWEVATTNPPPFHVTQMSMGLDEIPEGHPQTKSVNFAYNHLSSLENATFSSKSYKALHVIELYQNRINRVEVLAFKGLKSLKTVDLSENNITSLGAYTFEFNGRLEKLDLTGNQISFNRDMHFLVSHSLLTLVLSDNKLESIYEFSFVGVPKLRNLMLDYNALNFIEAKSFKPLVNLQFLSLAHSGVHVLSLNMFDSAPRILDLTSTTLGNTFDPPLRKLKTTAVERLLAIDMYLN